jgi:ABC-type multidrug transport system fused ATPase/permease subunit
MSFSHAHIEPDPTPQFGRQSARKTLLGIAKTYPGKLAITFSLVVLENALFLAYPLFAGFAVDAIVRGDKYQALLYAVVVLGFWVVGSARRAVDTRTFTAIYADIAVPVILGQRRLEQSTSTAAARVVLAREFVDFFERLVPTIATAVISLFGAATMLLALEPWVGLATVIALALSATFAPGFSRRNERLHQRLNNRLEREVGLVERVGSIGLGRHYRLLSRLRTALSDREAMAYLVIGVSSALLFAIAIWQLASGGHVTPGHIYAVMTYLWTFVTCLDEAPAVIDQVARLKDIGKRVAPGFDSLGTDEPERRSRPEGLS